MSKYETEITAVENALIALARAIDPDTIPLDDVAYVLSRSADLADELAKVLSYCRQRQDKIPLPNGNSDEADLRTHHAENLLNAAQNLMGDAYQELTLYLSTQRLLKEAAAAASGD